MTAFQLVERNAVLKSRVYILQGTDRTRIQFIFRAKASNLLDFYKKYLTYMEANIRNMSPCSFVMWMYFCISGRDSTKHIFTEKCISITALKSWAVNIIVAVSVLRMRQHRYGIWKQPEGKRCLGSNIWSKMWQKGRKSWQNVNKLPNTA